MGGLVQLLFRGYTLARKATAAHSRLGLTITRVRRVHRFSGPCPPLSTQEVDFLTWRGCSSLRTSHPLLLLARHHTGISLRRIDIKACRTRLSVRSSMQCLVASLQLCLPSTHLFLSGISLSSKRVLTRCMRHLTPLLHSPVIICP